MSSSTRRMKRVILWVAATVISSQTLYFFAEAAILVAAAACDGVHAVISMPFGFKRLSCLLLHVLDALAEDDDGVPRARAPLRLCVP